MPIDSRKIEQIKPIITIENLKIINILLLPDKRLIALNDF